MSWLLDADVLADGTFYPVINRGPSRRPIFLEDQGRQSFLGLLADIVRLWRIEIYGNPEVRCGYTRHNLLHFFSSPTVHSLGDAVA